MSRRDAPIAYAPAKDWWASQENLLVKDQDGETLMYFPLQFLRQGHVLTFTYVKEQCESAFEEGGVLLRIDGSRIADTDAVTAGQIVYAIDGQNNCKPRQGPRFKHKFRGVQDVEESTTMSNSKRSTVNQTGFRQALIHRDGFCLLTGALYTKCTAAHILPQSRPEYYDEALNEDVPFFFKPSFGLLLRDDLHHSFDRGEFALYPRGSDLIVHVFAPDDPDMRSHHGKVISSDYFRPPEEYRPDTRLLLFHYQQCVIKYLRGYAWGMEPPR